MLEFKLNALTIAFLVEFPEGSEKSDHGDFAVTTGTDCAFEYIGTIDDITVFCEPKVLSKFKSKEWLIAS